MQWQQLIWLFREAKLLSSLAAVLERRALLCSLPVYAQRHLQSALVYADRQAQQIRFECDELQTIFLNTDIKVLYLKGAAYTLADTENSRGRICNDIDVLVNKSQLAAAEALLKRNYWKSDKLSSHDERYYREWSHEIPPMVHILRGTVLDLHHNLYLPISGRSADMAKFFELVKTTNSGALVLNQEAMVLHSIIHLFMNEETQSAMRDLWDIHLLTAQYSTADFWNNLHNLALSTGFELEFRYCLTALKYYLGSALDPLTKNQCEQYFEDNWWVRKVLLPALLPDHPLVIGWQQRWAKRFMYFRGHFLKMPLHILLGHLTMKSFFGLRDAIFGKHQFSPKKN
ncbi:nucleotidyltransferase domain-containing protein [Rheinheimera sp. UJ63]|uniref:nucleotidyltransferase domain-containing protein n=1 Tax=Rheinheimera sp. UJ63 TaxID=2910157 RepID=UPI001F1CDB6F|nr:nucleotidyltransferase family protein [Rheinheimera sp. UJ63]MCF4010257.1 nucleotidyltransferase family protein [Rheinheimera sp. UJ63]